LRPEVGEAWPPRLTHFPAPVPCKPFVLPGIN
jgi:hypothetical protein